VPARVRAGGFDQIVLDYLSLPHSERDLTKWDRIVNRWKNPAGEVKIAIVGKYVALGDSYKSLNEALHHGGIENNVKVRLEYVDSEDLETTGYPESLSRADAVLVPGGFGRRGIEGMLRAIRYARETKVPFFGICLGMQCAVIEFARNVCGLANANSTEFDANAPHKVIYKLRDLIGIEALGGTMRLGKYPCELAEGSTARRAYGEPLIYERHRHRYEVNQEFLPALREAGLAVTGVSPDRKFVEMVELPDHPWFLGCQFHPEFKSKPTAAHPLFKDFVRAARAHQAAREEGVVQKSAALEPGIAVPAHLPAPNGRTA
jgi:CTP synthase (EC 6.3.4.2)